MRLTLLLPVLRAANAHVPSAEATTGATALQEAVLPSDAAVVPVTPTGPAVVSKGIHVATTTGAPRVVPFGAPRTSATAVGTRRAAFAGVQATTRAIARVAEAEAVGPARAEVLPYPAFLIAGAGTQVPDPLPAASTGARAVPAVAPTALAFLAKSGRHAEPSTVAPVVAFLALPRHGAPVTGHETVPSLPGAQEVLLTDPVRRPIVELLGHEEVATTELRATWAPCVGGTSTRRRLLATSEVAAGVAVALL